MERDDKFIESFLKRGIIEEYEMLPDSGDGFISRIFDIFHKTFDAELVLDAEIGWYLSWEHGS